MPGQGPYESGIIWPVYFVGSLAAVLLLGGLVPPYFEIHKRRGRVIGISASRVLGFKQVVTQKTGWTFLAIDWMGALLSLVALGSCSYSS